MKNSGFTVPPPLADDIEQMAEEEHRTKSEILREMLSMYRTRHEKHAEPEIDDEWVIRALREAQEEEERSPMTDEEFVAESKRLMEYGAQQATKLGIDVEDDEVIKRIIHDERARWREREKNRA
jgi:ribbon-helix-helix CopG family protein